MSVTGNTTGEINFVQGSTESVTIMDVTASATLSLRQGTPYLLIAAAGSDSDYANLVTASGSGSSTYYSLDGNGYVVGVATSLFTPGYSIASNEYNAIAITQENLTTSLLPPQTYPDSVLYLYNGNLEIVPEPGTWALMLGGLVLLVFIQQRRKNKLSLLSINRLLRRFVNESAL